MLRRSRERTDMGWVCQPEMRCCDCPPRPPALGEVDERGGRSGGARGEGACSRREARRARGLAIDAGRCHRRVGAHCHTYSAPCPAGPAEFGHVGGLSGHASRTIADCPDSGACRQTASEARTAPSWTPPDCSNASTPFLVALRCRQAVTQASSNGRVHRRSPAGRVPDLAGPEVTDWTRLLRDYLQASDRRRWVVPVRIPEPQRCVRTDRCRTGPQPR
jgi:hypothetical protein